MRIVRGLSLAAAVLLGAPPLVFGLPTSDSAFTATSSSPASVFTSDILDPPASFSAGRPCPPGATVAPTFRSRSTATSATGAGSLTVSAPSGIAAGDMVIAAVILDESDTSGWGGGGWGGGGGGYGGGGYGGGGYGGGGWNVAVTVSSAGGAMTSMGRMATSDYGTTTALFKATVPASPPSSYSFTFSDNVSGAGAVILAYSGATAADAVLGTASSGSSTITAPGRSSLTTAPATLIAVMDADDARSSTIGTPTGMTSRATVSTTDLTSTLDKLAVFDQTVASTGATGSRTSNLSPAGPNVGASVVVYGVTPASPTVNLTWTATPDTYADGYRITRSDNVTVTVSGRLATAYSDETTTASATYTYSIAATSAGGVWRSTTRAAAVPAC